MPEFEQDYVLRHIRLLAQAVARLLLKARTERPSEIEIRELGRAKATALGLDPELLERLDATSLALLVRDGESLCTLVWITAREAELLEALGDLDESARQRIRAVALARECAGRFPGEADACREALRDLADDDGPQG
jgi:hypothetical protein